MYDEFVIPDLARQVTYTNNSMLRTPLDNGFCRHDVFTVYRSDQMMDL